MSVAEILAQKGNDVITANTKDTLEDVSKILANKKIGAVMVLDTDGKVCGISSERDIVRLIAKHGASALDKKSLIAPRSVDGVGIGAISLSKLLTDFWLS